MLRRRICLMAALAIQVCPLMVIRDLIPGLRVVACLAGFIIDIRVCADELMAVLTHLTQSTELCPAVASRTFEQQVLACQGKGSIRMIEG